MLTLGILKEKTSPPYRQNVESPLRWEGVAADTVISKQDIPGCPERMGDNLLSPTAENQANYNLTAHTVASQTNNSHRGLTASLLTLRLENFTTWIMA